MNTSPVVDYAVELMVRLAATDPHVTAAELALVARSPSSTEALLARLRSGNPQARLPLGATGCVDLGYGYFRSREREEVRPGLAGDISGSPTRGRGNRVNLLQAALKTYILIFLRGVRLADLLPDAATTPADRTHSPSRPIPHRMSSALIKQTTKC
jgi:hypothetical protein